MDIGGIISSHDKTQLEVAKAIGSKAGYISQLNSGMTCASMKRLDELSAFYYGLLTIDPLTGESRKYWLVK